MIVSEILSYLQTELLSVSNMEEAIGMKAYMKNRFEFIGVTSPIRKDIIKHSFTLFTIKTETELFELVTNLWKFPYREYQYIALEYLYKYNKLISENSLAKFEYYILSKSWWDKVDGLGADAIGDYFLQFPTYKDNKLTFGLILAIFGYKECVLFINYSTKSIQTPHVLKSVFCFVKTQMSSSFKKL